MKEVLLTSSALILALLILRRVFRNRISRRAQYALWLLVLVRLLVPVSLPGVDFSLLTAAEPVTQHLEADRSLYLTPVQETILGPEGGDVLANTPAPNAAVAVGQASPNNTHVFTDDNNVIHQVKYQKQVDLSTLLRWVWVAGTTVMAIWLMAANLLFWRKLRKVRTPYSVEGCKYPVYLMKHGLSSPCLFGLLLPAIYLNPAATATPERLRHVIAHESAHARHFDPLWALLRGVCLAVWWFNPLVWAAAAASKADGELACDEAALAALGPAERVPYGQTLLALIPVHRGPGNPLLSATTMTAGKRQLKDRITRIAQGGQTRAAALFLAVGLAAVVCAVTFTGAKPQESRPLTGDELAYFNEEFFNNDTVNNVVGVNIHNQFLNSLYERPEDIDLYELFYCGTGRSDGMSEEELRQVGSFDESGSQICPTDKLAVSDLDAILLENTGLNLAGTTGTGLEQFQYLPEYDAYYHTHGDTNYFHSVRIVAGERSGDTLRLYYPDNYARYEDVEWLCVTLEAQSDGSYWFVSNQPSEKPAVPTVYPEGDPVLTIPLTDLTPYAPTPVPVERRSGDCAERGIGLGIDAEDGSHVSVRPYLSTDGNLYVAVIYDEAVGNGQMIAWDAGCFFTFPPGNDFPDGPGSISLGSFSDLFGHEGVVISYLDPYLVEAHQSSIIRDYYYFEDADTPVLLARTCGGDTAVVDLDGDGENELCTSAPSTAQIFFERDGQLYEANLVSLLESAWPTATFVQFEPWDSSQRNLPLYGPVPIPNTDVYGSAFRWLYFDRKRLLLYKDTATYTDHVADHVDVPEEVLAAAQEHVLKQLDWWQTHTGAWWSDEDGTAQQAGVQAEWDTWRITSLKLVDEASAYPELGLQIYRLSYELHSLTPELVLTAGGMYLSESGWVGGFHDVPFLVFQTREDGKPVLLKNSIPDDVGETSGNPSFAAWVAQSAMENGLLPPSQVREQDLENLWYENPAAFLNAVGIYDRTEQDAVLTALATDGIDIMLERLEHLYASSLTTAGLEAYERLLGIVNGEAEPPTEADIRAAILDHRIYTTAAHFDYATEAHQVLDQSWDGDTCTVYLMIYFSAYERTVTGWNLGTDGQFPGAITFVRDDDGGWTVQEYWEPLGGAYYAPDLQSKFPADAADTVLHDDALWATLAAQCRERAEEYFDRHPEPTQTV